MTIEPKNQNIQKSSELASGIAARAVQVLVMFTLMALELFLGSGKLNWVWAWVFLAIGLLSVANNSVVMFRSNPETIAERGRPKETRDWDKLVSGIWTLGQFIGIPIVAGLDARFSWTRELDLGWHILGAVIYALSLGLTSWAMISNAYFSTAVRIQSDRGQQVCDRGPYRFVRHPGYVGFFIQALSTPVLLGSLWALLFALPAGVLMVIRTEFEDRMLQEELPGYQEYSQRVKYRLLPGVW